MRILFIVSLLGLAVAQLQPQGPSPVPVPIVIASIKPVVSDRSTERYVHVSGRSIHASSSLALLISFAYQTEDYRLTGLPSWIEYQFYEVKATAEGDGVLTGDQFHRMLQTILVERFQLKMHRKIEEIPVYTLVVDRNGSKLKTSAADSVSSEKSELGSLRASRYPMTALARRLTREVQRRVVDLTGLTGFYDLQLEWAPEQGGLSDKESPARLDAGPSIFTAVREQLGLRLELRKNYPIEVLIIDHAEKPDSN
jgi:uncharacterized protein (TIGR03435 family)